MNQEPKQSDIYKKISQIQEQLTRMSNKLDSFIEKIFAELDDTEPEEKPAAKSQPISPEREIINQNKQQHQHPHQKKMYEYVCSECGKDCQLPFKSNGNRPVYCKECFAARKAARKPLVKVIKPAEIKEAVQSPKPTPDQVKTTETKKIQPETTTPVKIETTKTVVKKKTSNKKEEAPEKATPTIKKTTTTKKAVATKKVTTTKKEAPEKKVTTKKVTTVKKVASTQTAPKKKTATKRITKEK